MKSVVRYSAFYGADPELFRLEQGFINIASKRILACRQILEIVISFFPQVYIMQIFFRVFFVINAYRKRGITVRRIYFGIVFFKTLFYFVRRGVISG